MFLDLSPLFLVQTASGPDSERTCGIWGIHFAHVACKKFSTSDVPGLLASADVQGSSDTVSPARMPRSCESSLEMAPDSGLHCSLQGIQED